MNVQWVFFYSVHLSFNQSEWLYLIPPRVCTSVQISELNDDCGEKKKKRSCLQLTASYLSISFCTTSLDIVNNILLCFHFGASMAWICISELKWSVVFCFCLLFFIILISIIQEFARNQLLFFLFHNFYLFALTIFITIIQFSDFIEASMTSYIF